LCIGCIQCGAGGGWFWRCVMSFIMGCGRVVVEGRSCEIRVQYVEGAPRSVSGRGHVCCCSVVCVAG